MRPLGCVYRFLHVDIARRCEGIAGLLTTQIDEIAKEKEVLQAAEQSSQVVAYELRIENCIRERDEYLDLAREHLDAYAQLGRFVEPSNELARAGWRDLMEERRALVGIERHPY